MFWGFSFVAAIPAYALSTLWVKDIPMLFNYLGGMAVLLQLIAIYWIMPLFEVWYIQINHWCRRLLGLSMVSYLFKLVFQLLSAFPYFSANVVEAKSYVVIGYIHLVTLGFISLFLIAKFIEESSRLNSQKLMKIASFIFIFGFISTELLLFVKGLGQWLALPILKDFDLYMLIGSLMFFVATVLFLLVKWRVKGSQSIT